MPKAGLSACREQSGLLWQIAAQWESIYGKGVYSRFVLDELKA